MTTFSYSLEETEAILKPLALTSETSPERIVLAVTNAARHALDLRAEISAAPTAEDVSNELKGLEEGAQRIVAALDQISADMEETPAELRTLRAMLRKAELGVPADGLTDGLRLFVDACKGARSELKGNGIFGSTFMMDGVLTFRHSSSRNSRRGRPPNLPLAVLGRELAFIYRLATGKRPTVPNDKLGQLYGPFGDFVESATRPTGLLSSSRRVDSMAREARKGYHSWVRDLASIPTSEVDALQRVAERLGLTGDIDTSSK